MNWSQRPDLVAKVLRDSIPMCGRMIHGRDRGTLWEAGQAYDVHGRVTCIAFPAMHESHMLILT